MMSNDQRFVVNENNDLIPVIMLQGGGSCADNSFRALALFSPMDVVAIDNYNMSTLRQEVARIIPVALKIRKLYSQI